MKTYKMKLFLIKEGWKKVSKQVSDKKTYLLYKRDKEYCEICYDRKRLQWYQVTTISGELRGYRNFVSGARYYAKDVKEQVDKCIL